MIVVGCGRNIDKIMEQSLVLESEGASGRLYGFACDLRVEEQILTMFTQIQENYGGVDVLINNAGISFPSSILGGATSEFTDILAVNVLAPAICMREAVKQMITKGSNGHIININSLSGHRVPQWSPGHFYAASKYALTAMNEGVRQELRELKSRIRVTQVSPGPVHSEFRERMFRGDVAAIEASTPSEALTGADITQAIMYALAAPEHVQVHDILIRPTSQIN